MLQKFEKELSPEELANLPDEDIDTSEIPELDDDFWSNAVLRQAEAGVRSGPATPMESAQELLAAFRERQ
jgi:hypothetical protein